MSGGVYEKLSEFDEYLNLQSQNEALAQENATLKSLLFNRKDSTVVAKLATNKPDLFPFTGYKMINKIYGNGLMKPNKLILLNTITWRLSKIKNISNQLLTDYLMCII